MQYAPARANVRAVASPMPAPAPVMTAIFPWSAPPDAMLRRTARSRASPSADAARYRAARMSRTGQEKAARVTVIGFIVAAALLAVLWTFAPTGREYFDRGARRGGKCFRTRVETEARRSTHT